MSFLLAIVTAIVGVIPLLAVKKVKESAIVGVIATLFFWLIYWTALPSLVWPLFGVYGLFIFILWIIGAIIYSVEEEKFGIPTAAAIIALFLYIIVGISGCPVFRSGDYARLIGDIDEREWTQDVQPKDPNHIRLVPLETAKFLADKQLGEAPGAIGSQFHVANEYMTLQMINGELWYVAPLDFNGFTAWTATKVSPGYVMVHGEDPLKPVVVKFNEKFAYTPGAYWSHYLERHLWNNGYRTKGVGDYTFEIDESGKAWWTVTVFEPTIAWWGRKVNGVVVVDPTNGNDTFYPMGKIPGWIDRVIPQDLVSNYVNNWGQFSLGWWNSFWSKKNIIEGETPTINYGSNGEPYWVTCLTTQKVEEGSKNNQSLVGLIYLDSRTGRTIRYHAIGGTESSILTTVDNKVKFKLWHGDGPVLYNIYGTMASIVPLLGENHTFQGVAIVRVDNLQAAIGDDQYSALREYQKLIAMSGQQISAELAHSRSSITGKVDRFASEVKGTETIFYFHLVGKDFLFTGMSELSPKLPITRVGDEVSVEYIDAGESVVPLLAFDNLSLQLIVSPQQSELQKRVAERQNQVATDKENKTARGDLRNMSDQEIQELLKLKQEKEKK